MPRNALILPLSLLCLAACTKPAPPPPVPAPPTTPVVLRSTAAPPIAVEEPVVANVVTAVPPIPPPPSPREPELTSNIIAFVGDQPVMRDEFTQAFPADTRAATPEYLASKYSMFLNQLIASHVLGVAADHEVFTNEPGYQRDVDMALRQVKMRYFYNRYIQAKTVITDREVSAYYTTNKAAYTVPRSVRAWHILVEVKKGAFAAEVSNAFVKARGLRARLMEGEQFALVAAAESDDPSRGKGGDLGFRQPGQLVPSLEKAAFALRNNEISDVIRSEFGFNILQVTDRMPERHRALDEVQDEIRDLLAQRREQQLYFELLTALTNTYTVIRNEPLIQDLLHGAQ